MAEKITKTLQERLVEIQQALDVPKSQVNSFGGYKYRSCEDILKAVKPLLNGLLLVISDEVVQVGDRNYVKATVTLYSADTTAIEATAYAREAVEKKGMDVAQITGSASSYARKYALNGLFAIDDTRDADTMDNRADELHKAVQTPQTEESEWIGKYSPPNGDDRQPLPTEDGASKRMCSIHNEPMQKGVSKTKFNNDGTPKTYFSHKVNGEMCFGS